MLSASEQRERPSLSLKAVLKVTRELPVFGISYLTGLNPLRTLSRFAAVKTENQKSAQTL
jgi:hypothetical protein